MDYLTFQEFKELTGESDFVEDTFKKYLPKASATLDSITNFFYQFNDLETDPIKFRVNQFKLALCAEIIFFDEIGGSTFQSANTPQSLSIGATSISEGGRYDSKGNSESKSIVADDVYIYLQNTGLLYRGVES